MHPEINTSCFIFVFFFLKSCVVSKFNTESSLKEEESEQLKKNSLRDCRTLFFSPRHFQAGLCVYFGKNVQPTFLQNWNLWSRAIPFVTFAWHRGNDATARLPAHMQLDPFQQVIIQAITEAHNALQEGVAKESLEIAHNEPILIDVSCGFSPILDNYGILGFNRDRGKSNFEQQTHS